MSDVLREAMEDQLILIKDMKGLLESVGWQRLMESLKSRRLALRTTVLTSENEGLNGLIEDGKNKAQLGELEALVALPQALITEAEFMKMQLLLDIEAEEEMTDD